MINKIKEQRESCKSQAAPSSNTRSKTKITKLLMHRMIQRIKAQDNYHKNSSFVIHNASDDTFNNPSQHQGPFINIKKQAIKTEESQPNIESIFRKNLSKSRWDDRDSDTFDNWKEYRAKNFKVMTSGKASDFNLFISQRMKKVQRKKQKDNRHSQLSCDGAYYGLNVVQIKRIDLPNKQTKEKDHFLIKMKSKMSSLSKAEDNSSPSQGKEGKRKKTISLGVDKMQETEPLEDIVTQVQSLIFKEEPLKGRKRLLNKTVEGNCYKKKMKKMLECLDIIMNSYHCRLKLPIQYSTMKDSFSEVSPEYKTLKEREKIKYKYFIGPGNNSNLIRSLLRKRSWWVQVQNMNKASFIWSQCKIPTIIEKLETYVEEDWTNQIIFYEQINEETNPLNSNNKKISKKPISSKKVDNFRAKESSFLQLFHQKQSKKYHNLLNSEERQLRLVSLCTPAVLHNHYEHNYMFGNKNALYYNLSKYYEFTGQNLIDIMPLTFYLEKGNKSFGAFQKYYNDLKKKESIWILKPAENSNRGHGIEVSNSVLQIKQKLNIQKKLIVQYYIKDLLLYNNRKFDIRTYFIAVTIHGRMKFYWYEEGYIRTSSEIYDLENLTDHFVHLTNDAIQKNGENYGLYEEGNKLSYSEFQRYLEIKLPKEMWKMSVLHQKMKQIAIDAVKATYCRLDPVRKDCTFQLFGLDFLIDNQFKPYLIEINTNPCLELCSGVLERMIPRMMENMFRICLDPLFRPNPDYFYSKSQLYYMYDSTFLDRNKFSLIFDQRYDRNFEWEERCSTMRGLQWNIEEQEQYADDGKIIMVDY